MNERLIERLKEHKSYLEIDHNISGGYSILLKSLSVAIDIMENNLKPNLTKISTCDLVNALLQREGVKCIDVNQYEEYSLKIKQCEELGTGVAKILIVID